MYVRKAVIPAAGFGTRFLPLTKAVPKEMIPLVDKPAIQYVVEEAVAAGITDILLITGRSKRAIEDHFDRSDDLERALEKSQSMEMLAELRRIGSMATVHCIRQSEPLGLGHAVGLARHHVGNEPFVVMLPDDVMVAGSPLLGRMLQAHEQTGASILAVKQFGPADISAYGVVSPGDGVAPEGLLSVADMVEKPQAQDAPSDFAIMGRYLLTPEIFSCIDQIVPGAGGELQLTDALRMLAKQEHIVAVPFTEGRYDIGNKADWLRATVELALAHPTLGLGFRETLKSLLARPE
jgi:UTP--glucose-1-phosphate uridylyltransferase